MTAVTSTIAEGAVLRNRIGQIGVPIGVASLVVMMVVPLPTVLLDLLLAVDIAGSLLVLLLSMNVRRTLDFAVFPALLLIATLFRLALNVSSTRLVLLDGYAGKVIDAFGHFVVGGSLIVGLVIFLILIVIQFAVITNGATRVAEVGARFTLDAMPGKQMAIDADLNSGLIDEDEARRRRAEVGAEADFYGAMDGASKFVKGDAIAAIVITVINLAGGFLVGIVQKHMPFGDAVQTYSLLSIGDGLVSQIPALLMSVSTGLIVTRAASQGDLGSDIVTQFTRQRQTLRLAGIVVVLIALVPGLPKPPFLLLGVGLLIVSTRTGEPDEGPEQAADATASTSVGPALDSPEALAAEMRVDPLGLDLAPDLVDLVDAAAGGDLLDRVRALRRKIAVDLGVVLPLVRTRDDLELPMSAYAIRINGVVVARGEAPPGSVLAIGEGTSEALDALPGRATREPVFGLPARWLPAELRVQAELAGATVVDRASVITTHLAEVVRHQASRLLGREDVRGLTEMVRRTHPVVVEELTPALLSLGEVQRVLAALLDEGVAIRDLVRIFEAISLRARASTDPDGLVEAARAALAPALCEPYVDDGLLRVISLDPTLEQLLLQSVRQGESGALLLVEAAQLESLAATVARLAEAAESRGHTPVLACSPHLRLPLRRALASAVPRVPVLSFAEIGSVNDTVRIETAGVVQREHALAA